MDLWKHGCLFRVVKRQEKKKEKRSKQFVNYSGRQVLGVPSECLNWNVHFNIVLNIPEKKENNEKERTQTYLG